MVWILPHKAARLAALVFADAYSKGPLGMNDWFAALPASVRAQVRAWLEEIENAPNEPQAPSGAERG